MNKFMLEQNKWYACRLEGKEFGTSYSPIKVCRFAPSKTGDETFQLDFYHANYPAGVRDKEYLVEIIERNEDMIFARSTTHASPRTLLIREITPEWLMTHFPGREPDSKNLQSWLDHNF